MTKFSSFGQRYLVTTKKYPENLVDQKRRDILIEQYLLKF